MPFLAVGSPPEAAALPLLAAAVAAHAAPAPELGRLPVTARGGGRGVLVRHHRWRHAPYEGPVHAGEERVALDLGGAARGAHAAARVTLEQPPDEVPQLGGVGLAVELRVGDLLGEDVLEGGLLGVALERRAAVDELVEEDAEGPPVDAVAVATPAHELRREVLVRAHAVLGARRRRLGHELEPLLGVDLLFVVTAAIAGAREA